MTIEFHSVTVTARADNTKAKANVARCACGFELFCVFQVEGQDHFHLQCGNCGETVCSGEGECAADLISGAEN